MPINQQPSGYLRIALRWIAAIAFALAGINHFVNPAFYEQIIPPAFPAPTMLVAVSGVCEIAGGIGLLIAPLRRSAGWGLIALLVAVFPANIYMAMHPERFIGMGSGRWLLWLRLPLQFVFIAWIWFAAGLKWRPRVAGVLPSLVILMPAVSITGCTTFQLLDPLIPSCGYNLTKNIAYGSAKRLKLDVYVPRGKETPKPVVIFFYGGFWREGEKANYRFAAEGLTSRGFIAVLPDYRLYPEVTFPKFVEDGATAIRFVHDHIAEFGGDPQRIYLMGHSAGAHIAALLTLDEHYLNDVGLDRTAICATAALSGPYDFIPGATERGVFAMVPGQATPDPKIEPIHFVDGKAPPMLLIHGLRDQTVLPRNATRLAERIRSAGGEARLIEYPKKAHVEVVAALAFPFRWLAPTLRDSAEFFRARIECR